MNITTFQKQFNINDIADNLTIFNSDNKLTTYTFEEISSYFYSTPLSNTNIITNQLLSFIQGGKTLYAPKLKGIIASMGEIKNSTTFIEPPYKLMGFSITLPSFNTNPPKYLRIETIQQALNKARLNYCQIRSGTRNNTILEKVVSNDGIFNFSFVAQPNTTYYFILGLGFNINNNDIFSNNTYSIRDKTFPFSENGFSINAVTYTDNITNDFLTATGQHHYIPCKVSIIDIKEKGKRFTSETSEKYIEFKINSLPNITNNIKINLFGYNAHNALIDIAPDGTNYTLTNLKPFKSYPINTTIDNNSKFKVRIPANYEIALYSIAVE
jgi:hypothetical protein